MKKVMLPVTIAAAFTFCLTAIDLSAWQRKALAKCNEQEDSCTKSQSECASKTLNCRKHSEQKDEDSFYDELSGAAASRFETFNVEQKKRAMDLADNNQMAPEAAVSYVYKSSR